ncbi:hypothetical protein [Mesorhizobium sp.]|uniref:hypothetical protein n=1 Tax=Mesorhizobium sp. TaxID=1871066 RepID=UPI000FE697FB|nr:hypothetical protein [Mesorhizobium sp.]RWO91125.1 MAG: hypothetical protein EOQ95_12860 [Mesorhizobium sp.]RWQ53579.1 MAG: hypothetical protein EOS84_15345 [Mesorhizobium sp.]TIL64947.1 MAG: hypothetical protein E5Y77_24185 [Mesorhizobium sp.]TIM07650.1 MAG: hypothetical protein E5Y62_19000 [Mesorhizobium sp.]
MSTASISMGGQAAVTPAALGWAHIHWGLGLFITGFVTGFIPIAHYINGALAGDVGPVFLKNMTLWWGCPAILAELTLKTGGLGMIAIGLCYLAVARQAASPNISSHERIAPTLCAYGLIAELVTAGAGYAIGNYFWPNFYFEPVQTGKNLWLVAQGISIAVYVVGVCYASAGIRRASRELLPSAVR